MKKDSEKIGKIVSQKIIAVLGETPEPNIHVEFSFTER